jgi:DNA helicase HerA-like ATPase
VVVESAQGSEGDDVAAAAAGDVGQVVGTEDATPLAFHVAIYPDSYLQLDDVVATSRDVPGRGKVLTSGIVTDVRSRHEGASFGSDVFLISDGVLPARVQEIAEVMTTRVEPECYVPPRPGSVARRASGAEREAALYFDQMIDKVPVGVGRDGETVYVDLDFINGKCGAHVSISGISGVATKTSFALFLLHSLFAGELLPNAHNAKALTFSVKGEDLLFLDKANSRLTGVDGDDLKASYAKLDEVIGLANVSQALLGRFASVEYKDSRAPQNLVPIAGQENDLRHRLGASPLLHRALRAAAHA